MFFVVRNNAIQYRSNVKCCHLIWRRRRLTTFLNERTLLFIDAIHVDDDKRLLSDIPG